MEFVQAEWQDFIQCAEKHTLRESRDGYLAFENDRELQEMLPDLVCQRMLLPVEVSDTYQMPEWASAGVLRQDRRKQVIQNLLEG